MRKDRSADYQRNTAQVLLAENGSFPPTVREDRMRTSIELKCLMIPSKCRKENSLPYPVTKPFQLNWLQPQIFTAILLE